MAGISCVFCRLFYRLFGENLTHIFADFALLTHIFAQVADLCVK